MRTFLHHPQGEWLLDVGIAVQIIVDALNQLRVPLHSAKVLVPGIGKSDLAIELYRAGIINLVLWDVEEEALVYQQSKYESVPSTIKIEYWNALTNSHDVPANFAFAPPNNHLSSHDKGSYDVIVDKSFMDVFLRQGKSTKVIKFVQEYLKQDGFYFAFSMFHAKWKRMLPNTQWDAVYSSISVPRYSRTRPTVVSYYSHASVLIAGRRSVGRDHEPPKKKRKCDSSSALKVTPLVITVAAQIPFTDFKNVSLNSMPVDASFF